MIHWKPQIVVVVLIVVWEIAFAFIHYFVSVSDLGGTGMRVRFSKAASKSSCVRDRVDGAGVKSQVAFVCNTVSFFTLCISIIQN